VLLLGPMPDGVRVVVGRLVAEARSERPDAGERVNGYLLIGGPGGASYIDAAGEVWNWYWDWDGSGETVERVPDGPMKVGLVAIAAERVPELAAWLPKRPPGAADCEPCRGSGWLPPPLPRVKCPECNGMGWVL
jgi:hypothetical protein